MKLDRRTVLIGGGTGVGLVVAFALWPRHLGSELATQKGEQTFGNFIKVGRDGRVTVAVPQAETGQGAWTALPQIVADELGAAWESVGVEPAPAGKAYANPLAKAEGWPKDARITAEATSVRAFEQPLREAAAVAREMLVGAAADRWNVSPGDCEAADGFVLNGARTFTFGELAEEAATRTPPLSPVLRPSEKSRLAGKPLPRLDGPAKADGSLRFAADVRLPEMLFAAVRAAPPGGRLQGYGRGPFNGVRHIAARDNWIAVVADSWWTAEQALKAANPQFSGTRSAADLRPLFDSALSEGDAETWFERGDYSGVTRGSRTLAATYYVAPSQHLGLEPLSATARVSGGALEVWAGSQAPSFIADARLYPMPGGEPAGRALEADAVPYAIELARELKRPVQVMLSQAQGQNHDRIAPGALARMSALPGEGGLSAAWAMRVATADGLGAALERLSGEKRSSKTDAAPPYAFPNVRIEGVPVELPFAPGYMRGSPQRELTFFTESFMDELAHAAGLEPLSLRMALLGKNGRLARCLQAATRRAQWDGGSRGSTMGIAGASAFGSHIGLVADATIGPDQRVSVQRLVAAVDCGRVINASLAEQQVESGLIWALGQATIASPEWVAGMPRARSFGGLGLPRIGDIPEIVVEIIPSSAAPGGLNGLSTTVLAPAVANAIYAGTGKRMRTLPFDPMAVS
ncbi:MAG: molybdopterin cofactor-binding domain-containing protein [Pseudomonadota bacterium]